MKVLITGGSGFIGKQLVDRLQKEGHEIYNLDSKDGTENIDLLNLSAVKKALSSFKPEVVYHLAAFNNNPLSFKDPHFCLDLNFRGTLNILEGLRNEDLRGIIIPSTYYLKSQTDGNFDSPYIFSKHLQESLAKHFSSKFGSSVCVVRLANVYGHNPANETLLQSVSKRMLAHEPKIETGDLTLVRDFIYIEDVVDALCVLGQSEQIPSGTFELGNGEGVRLKDLIQEVKTQLGYTGEILEGAKAVQGSGVKTLVTDPAPLEAVLNWKPRFTIKSGLSKMLDQMKQERERNE